MPHDKIPGKTGENSEPNKHGYPNLSKTAVLIEHDITTHTIFLLHQEYDPNEIIGCKLLLLTQ